MFEEYTEIREKEIPIKNLNDYKIINLVGDNKVDRRAFIKYLLGIDEYTLPTTINRLETITYSTKDTYSAIITFYNKEFIHNKVRELLKSIIDNVIKQFEVRENLQYYIDGMYNQFENTTDNTYKLSSLLKYEDVEITLGNLYDLIKSNMSVKEDSIDFDNFISSITTMMIDKVNNIIKEFNKLMFNLGYNENYSYIKEDDENTISYILIKDIKTKKDFFQILNVFDNNLLDKDNNKNSNILVEGMRIIGNFIPNWYGGGGRKF